jgi:hypothetical protein
MQSPFHRSIVLVPAGHDDDLVRPVAVLGQAPASPGAELTAAAILDWAQAYCRAQQDPNLLTRADHPLWWALERFHLFTAAGRHEECWRAILAVSCMTSDPDVLGMLAAGPLEDLIEAAGPLFIDRLEWQAWTDPAFCRLLDGIWECGSPDVWARIAATRIAAKRVLVAQGRVGSSH